jgi:hypothetical protein
MKQENTARLNHKNGIEHEVTEPAEDDGNSPFPPVRFSPSCHLPKNVAQNNLT